MENLKTYADFDRQLKKWLFKMKLTLSIFLFCLTGAFASTYSQVTRLDITMKNGNMVELIKQIESKSEFFFYYQKQELGELDNLTVKAKNATVMEILDKALKGTPFDYSIIDRYIVVRKVGDTFGNDFLATTKENVAAQQRAVSGKVTDESGQPLPGVTIVIKGTTQGTVTNSDGEYSITSLPDDATLQFSFVGMRSQEVVVGNQTRIDIRMEIDAIGLEEVVAIGYGTQKKINITGSVGVMDSDRTDLKTVTKSSQILAGGISGISVRQLSGNPRKNEATIRIRGLGTFSAAGNNPLILIDGIASSLNDVNPNDIESISVLKDAASASIYGSRAANGVILVTTKKGTSEKMRIKIDTYAGKQQATTLPEFLDSWDYARAYNEALTNAGQPPVYSEEDIQKYKQGTDPNYPNFDHMGYLFDGGNGFQSKTNLNISGGTDKSTFAFSSGYLRQNGIVMKNYTNRYDLRLNIDSQIKDNVNFKVNLSGYRYDGSEPSGAYGQGIDPITRGALRLTNSIPGFKPDGYFGNNETIHPEADLNSKSFLANDNTYFNGTSSMSWNIFGPLKVTGVIGYVYSASKSKYFRATYDVNPSYTVKPNQLTDNWGEGWSLTMQSLVEYTKSFNNHSLHLLGGFEMIDNFSRSIQGFRDNFPNNDLYELNAGSVGNRSNAGGASRSKLVSYFGRINYSFNQRYLLEGNLRYDGSSRFPTDNRFALFPSFSAGWRISQEEFFQNALPGITNLMLRGSWGELGNQSVGDYPYQDIISLGQNIPFGNSLASGAAVTRIPNKNISWETTRMTDFGFDLSLFKSKLNFSADYFVKSTIDILYNISASMILGASPSPANAGTVENRGWDFGLDYKNSIDDFKYFINTNLSFVKNKVTKLAAEQRDISQGLFIGEPIGSYFGYKTDGLFVDEADIANYPKQFYPAAPGEVRMRDISGPDGVPDGVVDDYDRTVIGSDLPTYMYGLNMSGQYKNIDLFIQLQGEGGNNKIVRMWHWYAFSNQGNVQKWQYEQRWTPENPDRNAGYPRMAIGGGDLVQYPGEHGVMNDHWLRNASFLRVKDIQIGYSIPSNFIRKAGINKLRLYVSGQNILTFDKFWKGWDPEMNLGANQGWYPPTRTFIGGINLEF